MRVNGSSISLYERGFGVLSNRKKLCSSRCKRINTLTPLALTDEHGAVSVQEQIHRIERSETLTVPCSYASFIALIEAPVSGEDRKEAWEDAYLSLARMRRFWKQTPSRLPETLWGYIKKYVE